MLLGNLASDELYAPYATSYTTVSEIQVYTEASPYL